MKKHYCAEANRIITAHDCGSVKYENLEIKQIIDSRSFFEKELDELFREIGFAAVPLLTAAVMSFGFFVVMLIAVTGKWIITGTPF